ncbi:hypothetical protein JCM3766R1_003490 [Sporobolomyces carnicolor]
MLFECEVRAAGLQVVRASDRLAKRTSAISAPCYLHLRDEGHLLPVFDGSNITTLVLSNLLTWPDERWTFPKLERLCLTDCVLTPPVQVDLPSLKHVVHSNDRNPGSRLGRVFWKQVAPSLVSFLYDSVTASNLPRRVLESSTIFRCYTLDGLKKFDEKTARQAHVLRLDLSRLTWAESSFSKDYDHRRIGECTRFISDSSHLLEAIILPVFPETLEFEPSTANRLSSLVEACEQNKIEVVREDRATADPYEIGGCGSRWFNSRSEERRSGNEKCRVAEEIE